MGLKDSVRRLEQQWHERPDITRRIVRLGSDEPTPEPEEGLLIVVTRVVQPRSEATDR
mgnify:CR=1 FL=1